MPRGSAMVPLLAAVFLLSAGISSSSGASAAAAPPPASAPSPSSPSSTPDSVYATSGFEALSPLNRVAMLATIAVFLLLSVLSGRELWLLRYGSSPPPSSSASAAAGSSTGLPAAASSAKHNAFATPKHATYGGIPTPQSTAASTSLLPQTHAADEDPGASLSTGAEMRQRFFALLFAASTIRVVALVVEVTTLRAMETSPAASLYSRLLSMFLWLPALLFVSMYGLVLLFWAQLCYACWGKFHPWPRRLFFVFNVALYLLFAVLLLATSTSGGFWRACDVLLGAIYLVGFCGMLYYSVRLIQFFRNQGPDEDFFFDLPATSASSPRTSPRQIVLRRITAVCVLLSVLFVAKGAYMMGLGIGVVPSEETQYRSPVGVHHVAFEFAMHLFTEFVPCALLLFFTRKQSKPVLAGVPAAGAPSGGNTTPGLPPTGGMPSSHFGLRGRNNSSHSAYQDDTHSVGSGSLTGYQFQAVQRSYGSALTSAMRSTPTTTSMPSHAFPSVESLPTATHSTAATSGAATSYV